MNIERPISFGNEKGNNMLANIKSHGLSGINGFSVQVQVDISKGLPSYETVGLPDAAVREGRERVRAAIKNSGFAFPVDRIVVNLAPAGRKKEGAVYDLPIAVGLMAASGQIPSHPTESILFLGELALDGRVRPITGVLPMVIDAHSKGCHMVAVPAENGPEASYIEGVTVLPVESLRQLVAHLRGEQAIAPCAIRRWDPAGITYSVDFSEIRGQQGAKRAAEIAVAGSHNMLLIGTPGSGKTMLARSIPSILPELTFEEALEITKIHSAAGVMRESKRGIISERPFRAPYHGASAAALVGGGAKAAPGEISLAHCGVLFLDEFPEFHKDVLEALRQPLEDGVVHITRAAASASYPAQFMLVAAMNPCPCGYYGSRITPCRCKPYEIHRYQNRISGPLLDRTDLFVEMSEVGYSDLTGKAASGEASSVIRARVEQAREMQRQRYNKEGIWCNAQLNNKLVRKYCALNAAGERLLGQAFASLKLSARAYGRILKVARTIADLAGEEMIAEAHIAEAIQYRRLDGAYWGEE